MNEVTKVKSEIPEISKSLWTALEGKDKIYLSWTNDLSDFRSTKPFSLLVHTKGVSLEIPVLRQHLISFVGVLGASIFSSDRIVICWNIKELFSHFRFHLKRHFRIPVEARFVDLKLVESFAGIMVGDRPLSYEEAIKRAGAALRDERTMKINNLIYTPLAVEVVPSIESVGLANRDTERMNYSSYNIEGASNGRMSCSLAFDGCFTPHNMTSEIKNKFSPGPEKKFVVFDYKSMETYVLHWLSQDPVLEDIINSGEDIYSAIYRNITGAKACSVKNRKWIKSIFLPVVFGMQAKSLSERAELPLNGAQAFIDVVNKRFPVATGWVQSKYEEVLKCPTIKDAMGRTLHFGEGSNRNAWDVRNLIVSAPSALICIEKLIKLYQQRYASMEVVASIHDAYVCTIDRLLVESVAKHTKELLESPSLLAPNLKLKVGVEVGDSWGDTIPITLEN